MSGAATTKTVSGLGSVHRLLFFVSARIVGSFCFVHLRATETSEVEVVDSLRLRLLCPPETGRRGWIDYDCSFSAEKHMTTKPILEKNGYNS